MMMSIEMKFFFVICAAIIAFSNAEKKMKCEPSEKQLEGIMKCYKEVVGKELNLEEEDEEIEALDKPMQHKLMMCILTDEGSVDEEGFNAEKAEEEILEMKSDAETKDKLVEIMKKCAGEHDKTKIDDIMECIEDESKSVCGE